MYRFLKNAKPSIQYSHFSSSSGSSRSYYHDGDSNLSGCSIFEGHDISSIGSGSSSSRSSKDNIQLTIPLSFIANFRDVICRVGDSRDVISLYLQSLFDTYHDNDGIDDYDDNYHHANSKGSSSSSSSSSYMTVPKNMICPMLEAIRSWITDIHDTRDNNNNDSSESSITRGK